MSVQWLPSSLGSPLLSGPVAVDDATLIPRFWATVWAVSDGATLAPGTLRRKLTAIDGLYRHATRMGCDLDTLIGESRINAIADVATGHFVALLASCAAGAGDINVAWETARDFLTTILHRIGGADVDDRAFAVLHARIIHFERQLANLAPRPRRWKRTSIRALPSQVVEELYDILAPTSPRNPFRTKKLAWRNWCLLLVMLHQGLRTGEALLLPVGAVRSGVHPLTGKQAMWMNIVRLHAEDDPRFAEPPSIKTEHSVRQIPVSYDIANSLHEYEANWRGRRNHPFMFVNPRGEPLSTRGARQVFETVSAALSSAARKMLVDAMHEPSVRPHDLRHSCAVVRLTHLRSAGIDEQEALQMLRAFFGWSPTSDMPRLYARAYYESRLVEIWRDGFDAHVEALRRLAPPVAQAGVGR